MLPDFFPPQAIARLETELHSRKYSYKTMQTYIHYNCDLYRTTRKAPAAIETADIKRYLALLEKTRDFSASSMNLAISSIRFFTGQKILDRALEKAGIAKNASIVFVICLLPTSAGTEVRYIQSFLGIGQNH
jgi:hypothetical protein